MKLKIRINKIFERKISNSFALVIGLIILLSFSEVLNAHTPSSLTNDRYKLKLNPDYKIKRLSTGVVIAYSNSANGEIIRHEFENIYAEVLLGAVRKQTVDQLISAISRKYYYQEDECRREIKHAVHVLQEWNILIPLNTTLL